jgi:hypothetical protein
MPHETPSAEGHYWAKLVRPHGMPEGEDWASVDYEIVQVSDNNGEGDDKWRVYVAGIEQGQLLDGFIWGPRVPDLDNKAAQSRPIVTQEWTHSLTCMQQTVLLTAVRGPDGVAKYHPVKFLLRWYRRCVLLGALDHNVFATPYDPRGGSFTGPSYDWPSGEVHVWQTEMDQVVQRYLQSLDELPHHFQLHLMHAAEIVGYKHPDDEIREWWNWLYFELVKDMHLAPESEQELDYRLGDNEAQWRATSSEATQA